MRMQKIHLPLTLAAILSVGIASAGATEPEAPGAAPATTPAPIVFMGKTWCLSDAPATTRCDVRVDKERPSWLTRLRLTASVARAERAPEATAPFTKAIREVRARLQGGASQASN